MTSRPHDALFKAVFGVSEHAAALCRAVLPQDPLDVIDLSSVHHDPTSFVDNDLADLHGDLLLHADVRLPDGVTGRGLIYVLVEHQSSPDVDMPLRLAGYVVEIWKRARRAAPAAPLPLIIPVVLSHAPGGWMTSSSLRDLFDPRLLLAPQLVRWWPSFPIVVEDLATVTDADLAVRVPSRVARLTWWLLRDARTPSRLRQGVATWAADMERITDEDPDAVAQLLRYLTLVLEPFSLDEFRAKLAVHAPKTAEAAMTAGELLLQQGIEKGIEKGRLQGQVETLIRLLELRFGALSPSQHARIATASHGELTSALERILSASSADAVLAP